jgi:hypothetical protein
LPKLPVGTLNETAPSRAERQAGRDVIDDLRRDPREIDRVDRRQIEVTPQPRIGEQRFDDVLAVVERALDRQRMRVRRVDGRHLTALHLGDAAVRIQHENVERGAVAARRQRRRAGVARGRADDRHMLGAARQDRVEHQPDELQREVLEGQGRAVEQLEQPQPLVELHQRRHRRVPEDAIGARRRLTQLGGGEAVAGEQPDDAGRQLGIGQPGPAAQRLRVERRQPLGHEQPAVAGEPGEQHLVEPAGCRSRPRISGAQVMHRGNV